MNPPANVRNTPWQTPGLVIPENAPTIPSTFLDGISNLKSYSLRNGSPSEVEPYLLTASIPAAFHWVPMNGLPPTRALECMDGFIRTYRYRIAANTPPAWNADDTRLAAIILGVTRAVMTNDFGITPADINAQELAGPVMAVTFPEDQRNPRYVVLLANNDPHLAQLTDDLALTEDDKAIIKVIIRSSQAIVPLQGHNLIVDGHHYSYEKTNPCFSAFLAVERQVWVPAAFKNATENRIDTVRDIMWHKSGHPIAVAIKETAATDPSVKAKLVAAKLGSATARLPAMETEIRAAESYVKVAEAVNTVWKTMGGGIHVGGLRFRVEAVKNMPRGVETLSAPLYIGGNPPVTVTTRSAAISALKESMNKNSDKVATIFGFYCSMMDDAGDSAVDTLRLAHSLNRLRNNCPGSYFLGLELYKDYKAMLQRGRSA